MPTLLPRVKVTLAEDAQDRLAMLAAHWGVSVAGLLRCMAERLAEQVQFVHLPQVGPVWVRGGPFPHALLLLLDADRDPGRDALEVAAEALRPYAADGAGPGVTFRPKDLTLHQVERELAKLLRSEREAGATAPPGARGRGLRAVPGPSSPPSSNTGVVLPLRASQGRPRGRKL